MIFSQSWLRTKPVGRHFAAAFGLGGVFRLSSSSAYLLRKPSPSAPREVPTPLVFVYSSRWDPASSKGMKSTAAWFAERGYTSLEIDLAQPAAASTAEALMAHYESELSSHIRLLAIPFAPVIVARAGATLIAQTYISSHPASALLLISPPPTNAALSSSTSAPALLPTPLPEHNFEAKFPCAIMCTENERSILERENRLWKDPGVDRMVVKDEHAVSGQAGLVKIEQWLDEIGI